MNHGGHCGMAGPSGAMPDAGGTLFSLEHPHAACGVLLARVLDLLVAPDPARHEHGSPARDDRRVDQAAVPHGI